MNKYVTLATLALSVAAASAAGAADDQLHPFLRGSWKQIRDAHAGEPIVVHFWGLTCGPCRVEMPQLGRFLAERGDLKLVMIDADFVPNDPHDVAVTLAETGLARVENWIFADNFTERLRYEIDPRWQGDIPRTLLIAGDGSMSTIEGVADIARIRAWLDVEAARKR
jgi:thiol-disulfide isomerase/thioredoxin